MDINLLSVLIPCARRHINLLDQCFDSIQRQTLQPFEIIISTGPLSKDEQQALYATLDYGIPLHVLTSPTDLGAGANRNRAANQAIGDVLVFTDADDVYHPQRLEIILDLFQRYTPSLLLHSFHLGDANRLWEPIVAENIQPIFADTLHHHTFGDPPHRDLSLEKGYEGDTNIEAPYTVTHGHVAVRKEVLDHVQYTDMVQGEDGRFCRDILWRYAPYHAQNRTAVIAIDAKGSLINNFTFYDGEIE